MHEGYVLMRRGLTLFTAHRRINKGMLLARMHRAQGVLYGLAVLGLLALALACALLARFLSGVLG